MELLGVGRSTVREAVRTLANLGMVESLVSRGTYVRSRLPVSSVLSDFLAEFGVADLLAFRRALEVEAAQLASISSTAALALQASDAATPAAGTLQVSVPSGGLTITTPWTAANPLVLGRLAFDAATSTFGLTAPVEFASATNQAQGIQVVNNRSGKAGFTAQVTGGDFSNGAGASFPASTAGLVDVAVAGNAGSPLDVTKLAVNDVASLSATAPQTFASYTGSALGTAWLSAAIDVQGVPSGTPAGVYTATITFTAF